MQNQNTPPPEESKPTQNVALTRDDQNMIIFALGGLSVRYGFDENRKPTPGALRCLDIAKKFGVK
jgi:hypothetical protein